MANLEQISVALHRNFKVYHYVTKKTRLKDSDFVGFGWQFYVLAVLADELPDDADDTWKTDLIAELKDLEPEDLKRVLCAIYLGQILNYQIDPLQKKCFEFMNDMSSHISKSFKMISWVDLDSKTYQVRNYFRIVKGN